MSDYREHVKSQRGSLGNEKAVLLNKINLCEEMFSAFAFAHLFLT